MKFNESAIVGCFFDFGCVFPKCVLPERLAKEPPKMMKVPKCLDAIDCTMVFHISTCEYDAKTATDNFESVPDLF